MNRREEKRLFIGLFVALTSALILVCTLFRLATQTSQETLDVTNPKAQDSSVNASQDEKEHSRSSATDDRIIHILPGLLGDPVSDMRTYSIPLVYSYRGRIPTRTTMVLQGVIVSSFGTQGFLIADNSGQKEVLCEMSSNELEEAAYLYKRGEIVQIMGKYYDQSFLPVMRGCTMSSKSQNVVALPDEGLPKYLADALHTADLAPNPDKPGRRELALGVGGETQFIPAITNDDCGASSCSWVVLDAATEKKILQGGSGSLFITKKITNGYYDVVVVDGTANTEDLFVYEYVDGQYTNILCYEVPINPDGAATRTACPVISQP